MIDRIKERGYVTLPAMSREMYVVRTESGKEYVAEDRVTAMRDYSLALLKAEEEARLKAMAFYGTKNPQDLEGLAWMFYSQARERGLLNYAKGGQVLYLSDKQASWLNNVAERESAGEIDLFDIDRMALDNGLVITTYNGKPVIQKPFPKEAE